jgi:hypothetical protein
MIHRFFSLYKILFVLESKNALTFLECLLYCKVSEIESLLAKFGDQVGLNIKPATENLSLPPASVQTFLKKVNLSGVVLADHDTQYNNQ